MLLFVRVALGRALSGRFDSCPERKMNDRRKGVH